MQQRVNIHVTDSKAITSVLALENYINASGLPKPLIHLIKVRASQINGCAFCINMHNREALKDGETSKRLFLLNVWKESEVFTDKEQALLKLTEAVTLINKAGVSDETYSEAKIHFSELQIAQIIMVIATINVWNRIAISTNMPLDS